MERGIRKRIDQMFSRDRRMAQVALLLLWVTLAYVYFAVTSQTTDSSVRIALTIGAGGVLVFNSASILAMIRHYKEDKDHIYGLDIRHLDENRARKAELARRDEETLNPAVE
ncbi:hypothetical protein J8I87_01690 [Paraburkholderia sp. LEh10]|jgi:nitrate/nitrite-specific signal transduction histidine kinase|uniref:hypothetical protein n=1 Tax=Paraburkholderia sp. LEh10 TaxID=2821353 RepID=UPI001AEB7A15|nr:hypothetical protein [Paraburkholderia sp. LEh10]MBP0588447.1 hypothetical protein [Paraburkholderia sp. LEh10]